MAQNNKKAFIEFIDRLLEQNPNALDEEAMDFYVKFKAISETNKPLFTESGKAILRYMRENKENYSNMFQAKSLGEGMGTTSKKVSGAMRKLVTDGFLEKIGENPVTYSLTKLGESVSLDEE